jgi:hypothetical protein
MREVPSADLNPASSNPDLHAHSTQSDGVLSPRALVQRAQAQGVSLFALTDHDELGGLAEAQAAAEELGLRFVPGVEISVTWAERTVHIVGLGVDAADATLVAGLSDVRAGRRRRAQQMAQGLARVGIDGSFEGALAYADNPNLISRTHFARYLVEQGVCADMRTAFSKCLLEGKPGYVPHRWARLSDAVRWIRGAGGVVVLAHPGRYNYDATAFDALLAEFKDLGGDAIEVATSNHSVDQVRHFAQLAQRFGFEASRGSDFHGPRETQAELGRVHALPPALTPVWRRWI